MKIKYIMTAVLCWISASYVAAQTTAFQFDTLTTTPNAPLEMSSDQLAFQQNDGSALFQGNVLIAQGDLKLAADTVQVAYSETGGIEQMMAQGAVTFVTSNAAVESNQAVYNVVQNTLILTGNVLMTQGQAAISAEKMRVDLMTGQAVFEGRVRTILQSEAN